jgi:hypothetical protein
MTDLEMEEMRNAYNILIGKPEGKTSLGVHRRRLECMLGKYEGKVWSGFIWLRIGTSGELL